MRYSKKRERILACLRGTKEHPSAEWIYAQLKPEYPRLSLATVYRNLAQLRAEDAIISLGTVNGQERFDACTAPHIHAVCTRCGRVCDVEGVPFPSGLEELIREQTGYEVRSAALQFAGLCADCAASDGQKPL